MPDKYHITPRPVPRRRPRIGRCGVGDWREDCAGCHNCVKRACVFDRYREEANYIRNMREMDALFFQCMGCFTCVQQCTKGLLSLSINPVYERLGNSYWTPQVIETTWAQAETARIPVSGAGYRGPFSGAGFDSMWTDMSEIVRPTRDGIHGREYISTAVDIGRKPSVLQFEEGASINGLPPLVDIPIPMIIDMMPQGYRLPNLLPIFKVVAERTGTIAIVDFNDWDLLGNDLEQYLPGLAPYLSPASAVPDRAMLKRIRLVEVGDGDGLEQRIAKLKDANPAIVVSVRIDLDARGLERSLELAGEPYIEALHLAADASGNELNAQRPRFIKDMLRQVHTELVRRGIRNEVTLIAGGGIALPEHMAKQIICGADLVSVDLPFLISLECTLCRQCNDGMNCRAGIPEIDTDYGVGRMVNLIAAWHDQLIEVMGAMGIRDVRRLRGEAGRALFYEELEEASFGKLFGKRNNS